MICISCENEQVVEITDTYVEKVVVRAELKKGSLFNGVSITRTLPLNSSYDINKAEFEYFTGYLRISDTVIVPIHYTSDGIYKPLHSLKIIGGTKYELIANADGKQIYALTTVPDTIIINSISSKEGKFIVAQVTSNQKYVYGAIWTNNSAQADDFYSIVEPFENSSTITVQTKEIPSELFNGSFVGIKVYAFEKSYSEYFKTKQYSQSITNIFAQGGGSVSWNVKGDNIIGMFIGYAESGLKRL